MFSNYFKIAFRSLIKQKTYTLVNITGLAIGLSACLIIYLMVSFELSFDTFHKDQDRIFRVVSHINIANSLHKNSGISAPIPWAMRREFSGLEVVAPFHLTLPDRIFISQKNNKVKTIETNIEWKNPGSLKYILTDNEYFKILHYQWLAGDPNTALSDPFHVVLSQKQAQIYFGTTDPATIMGRTISYADYSDTVTVTVSGIISDWKDNTDFHFTDFISFSTIESTNWKEDAGLTQWTNTNSTSQVLVKLTKGTTPSQIESQFSSLMKKYASNSPNRFQNRDPKDEFILQPLSDIHFNQDYNGVYIRLVHLPTLYSLLGVAIFLLIMACINFVNLSTAQSVQRSKEIGIRKVLGSTRWSLIVQFLSETFLITFGAILLAFLFTPTLLSIYNSFIPSGVTLDLLNPFIILFSVGILVVTTLLAGFYPAVVLSSYLPVLSLKNHTSGKTTRKAILRKSLIIFQFAFSQIFIIGTIIIESQIHFMRSKDMGFNKDEILYVQTPWSEGNNKKKIFFEKIKQFPEVQMLSWSERPAATSGDNTTGLLFRKGKKEIEMNVSRHNIDSNFLELYGIKLLAGRNIQTSDSVKEILINEEYAKILGFNNPRDAVGQFIIYGEKTLVPITGVVANFNTTSLYHSLKPVFLKSEIEGASTINIKLNTKGKHTETIQNFLKKVEAAWKDVYPYEKFNYKFMDDAIDGFYQREQQTATLVNTATGLAIFIACMGLFGLIAFTTQQRAKEIGIRKILGASVQQIIALLSKDFLLLVCSALLIAIPIAWYAMNKWLADFAYHIDISWWIFVVAGISAIGITLITISYQSIKAALANPVHSLRDE
ncbi:ABC transporter permease [Cytophagaceae bacterium DM2B3-1]|uniref:ABC transporter permease n=1 Tax=Xanthocytophaga flava TaxID=3048013 RepID=A0ABT7CEB8_9BACT|nr:ABC transporter permease [Xanthocytophaga flavus]MDJ1468912.1 ABC transporter permease [Xanthocytophaga flavus]MDJ1492086.1 ABC transporter permease [Xanthocytophaga flavus]